jgi:nitroreductase
VIETILTRRSRREGFQPVVVNDEELNQIVACGLAAPSSKNAQPWRVHVVTDGPTLGAVADDVDSMKGKPYYVPINPATGTPRPDWRSTVSGSAQILREVSVGLFLENRARFSDGRHNVSVATDDVREDALVGYGLEMLGLGAAMQNMWLGAVSLGLSGVFMGDVLIAEDLIRRRLDFEGDLVGVLALGRSQAEPTPKVMSTGSVVWHSPPNAAHTSLRPDAEPTTRPALWNRG